MHKFILLIALMFIQQNADENIFAQKKSREGGHGSVRYSESKKSREPKKQKTTTSNRIDSAKKKPAKRASRIY